MWLVNTYKLLALSEILKQIDIGDTTTNNYKNTKYVTGTVTVQSQIIQGFVGNMTRNKYIK